MGIIREGSVDFKPLTFEEYLERCQRALAFPPPRLFDEMGMVRIPEYNVIKDGQDRTELKQAMRIILSDAKKAGIEAVVAEGFSGKPAAFFFIQGWGKLFPDDQKPAMFSLGDCLVDKPGSVHVETEIEMKGNQRIREVISEGKDDDMMRLIAERFHKLMGLKDRNVMFISEFVDQGRTFSVIERVFKKLGFTKLHFAGLVVNHDQYDQPWSKGYRTKTPLWEGTYISDREHIEHPLVPWLHVRSVLYNEYKKPEHERNGTLVNDNRERERQTYEELGKLANQL
jgi:hypothetical protein